MEKVKVINLSSNPLPEYQTAQAVGLDVRANTSEAITIAPLERVMVPTGLYFQIPDGYEIQVRPRSGLAAKHGITVINTPGTIDPDYRGELKVLLVNLSNEPFALQPGERVAQLVFARYERLAWEETVELEATERGAGGFGSTGLN
ncbi:MAG TPA: dUTP diphosphatase [Candidatus Rikenella faecigallinarum]|uniref:Deoxyuridine 5'-triphosphate nucleotidohydrolase n=1 Tax=Candidatus Rikenella faecigallinarum TaxID=2838745 RepID=A0A9D1QFW1_9BACT|nr:dUTP diphosphatase [Candidatus Rikenella faecigallinarum]